MRLWDSAATLFTPDRANPQIVINAIGKSHWPVLALLHPKQRQRFNNCKRCRNNLDSRAKMS